MHRLSRVHFMTAYLEYLLRSGIRSEREYIGDASRFMRYLLSRVGPEDVEAFIGLSANSDGYAHRLRQTLRKFMHFAEAHLELERPERPDDPV